MALSILPLGDRAILVTLGNRIAPEINDQVMALYERLVEVAEPGIDFFTPAFYSLGVGYDPAVISFDDLSQLVQQQFELIQATGGRKRRLVRIPVCYSPDFGFDLEHVAATTGMTCQQVVEIHSGKTYRAYMLGFLPGFAYLGSVDDRLRVDRQLEPRLKVTAGSVALAGEQTGVYPCEAPGGWQIIGRTPVSLYGGDEDRHQQEGNQFLVSPGDDVQFYQIDRAEFDLLFERSHVAGEEAEDTVTGQVENDVSSHRASLHFKTAGLRTAIQDRGRPGYQHLGVPSGGAMDRYSATIANLLVGNATDAALLEITLMGPTIEIQGDCQIAITGGDLSPMLDGRPVAMWETISVVGRQRLSFGSRRSGCRCYLAIAGEFKLPSWLGSVSVSPAGADSATEFRSLKGETVEVVASPRASSKRIFPEVKRPSGLVRGVGRTVEKTVQFLPGPEWDCFSAEQQQEFLGGGFEVLPSSNSMGLRLSSFLDQSSKLPAMVSSPVVPGVIQVTPSGQPILLMRDAQTTGGYPRIGVVCYECLNEVAQLCPGDSIRFELVLPVF